MRLLLDTHVLIWLVDSEPMPQSVMDALEDKSNELFVSAVTPWEMQIKQGTGKLKLSRSVSSIVQVELSRGNVHWLPVSLDHIDQLADLAHVHRDPFDRMLVAQAITEQMTIVSSDAVMKLYPVDVMWT